MARIPLRSLTFPDLSNVYVIPQITSLAPKYSNASTYTAGSLVTQDNNLYRCNTDINAAEEWTPNHWDLIPMSTVINGLNATTTRLSNRVGVVETEIERLETKDRIFSFEVNEDGHLIETVERYDSTKTDFKLENGRLIVTYG